MAKKKVIIDFNPKGNHWIEEFNKINPNNMNITQEQQERFEKPLENNLYNRLKPEIAVKLDAIATRYPSIHRSIKEALQDTDLAISLRFEIVSEMGLYLGLDLNYFLSSFESYE